MLSMMNQLKETWPVEESTHKVALEFGHYANVIDIGGDVGFALTIDGVGTKVKVAQAMGIYDTLGIDCVAMNVNDLLCVGATPITMLDYLALHSTYPPILAHIIQGFVNGARLANISICGGETAAMKDVMQPFGFDVVGAALGTINMDRIIIGENIIPGDALIGIVSNGLHSNGFTRAREAIGDKHQLTDKMASLGKRTLGEELLRPTYIYVLEILGLLQSGIPVTALYHITGGGYANLHRHEADIGWEIHLKFLAPTIFSLLQSWGSLTDRTMYETFNMGVGFCVAVPSDRAGDAIRIIERHGKQCMRIGTATEDKNCGVRIVQKDRDEIII
jgi:phosphoribosylformylglycinamidine cyclo-ligase